MNETNMPVDSLKDVRDIRQMMERSSRFISLSGLSGVAAGVSALVGAWVADKYVLKEYYHQFDGRGYFSGGDFQALKFNVIALGLIVFVLAFSSSFYFTWRKSTRDGLPVWSPASRRLAWNMTVPLLAGGLFILGMLRYDQWAFVAPACLLFYGLALVNASKYTVSDIRYLGYCEIILGVINMYWIGYGLYFWAFGFGILHIIYGIVMWRKYDAKKA